MIKCNEYYGKTESKGQYSSVQLFNDARKYLMLKLFKNWRVHTKIMKVINFNDVKMGWAKKNSHIAVQIGRGNEKHMLDF